VGLSIGWWAVTSSCGEELRCAPGGGCVWWVLCCRGDPFRARGGGVAEHSEVGVGVRVDHPCCWFWSSPLPSSKLRFESSFPPRGRKKNPLHYFRPIVGLGSWVVGGGVLCFPCIFLVGCLNLGGCLSDKWGVGVRVCAPLLVLRGLYECF